MTTQVHDGVVATELHAQLVPLQRKKVFAAQPVDESEIVVPDTLMGAVPVYVVFASG